MRKKLFAIVMSMTMVASFMPSLAFADATPCTHTKTTTKYALVKAEVADDAVTADNATIVDAAKADPTCVDRVVTINVCDTCGKVVGTATPVVAAKGHDWDVVNAKKVDKGCQTYDEQTCKTCGETRKVNVDNATGKAHDFTKKTVAEATCTEAKQVAEVCDVCGYEQGKVAFGKPLGHDIADRTEVKDEKGAVVSYNYSNADEYVAATCQYGGKAVYKCKRAGCNHKVEYGSTELGLKQLKHKYSTTIVKYSDPTCTELGKEGYVCTTCVEGKNPITGAALVKAYDGTLNTYGKALGHNYVSDPDKAKNDVAPTCTVDGTTYLKCSVCGDAKVEHPKALGHDLSKERVEVKAATCTAAQVVAFKCSRCDYYENERTGVAALGHEYAKKATLGDCNENPSIAEVCVRCNDVKSTHVASEAEKTEYAKEIAALKATLHDFEVVNVVPSTCSKEGVKTYKCADCGEVKDEAVAKLSHTIVKDAAVAATSTKTGLTAGEHCSVCNEVVTAQKVTVAKAKAPTVKAGKKQLTVTASKVTGATKYQVAYKQSGKSWKYATASTKNAQTIKRLKSGKKYYVKVRTISGSVKGAWSSTKSVKVK